MFDFVIFTFQKMDWSVSKSLTMGALFAKEVGGRSQGYQFMQHDAFVQALLYSTVQVRWDMR
jgi:hypothetical protein